MNFRRIKHMLLRLSPEEKIAGIGVILVLISVFLPWYSVVFSFNEQGITESGFTGDLGVVGFVIFLLTLMGLAFLIGEHLHFKLPNLGFKKDNIILFLLGQSAFLLLLTIAIYTKRSFEYTNAELRFGLYLALIGAFIGTFASFSQIQKKQKKDVEAFFSHPKEAEEETEKIEDNSINDEPAYKEQSYMPEAKKEQEVKPTQAEQKSFFYEESAEEPIPQTEVTAEESTVADEEEAMEPEMIQQEEPITQKEVLQPETVEKEEIIEDEPAQPEMIEEETPAIKESSSEEVEELELDTPEQTTEATEEPSSAPASEDKPKEEVSLESPSSDQGDYFVREAGIKHEPHIKVDMDSIRPVEKKPSSQDKERAEAKEIKEERNFYDDL